jgi:membrane associated rhomboid family serine protease
MFPIRDHNPSQRTPFVTYALIALNVAIWGWSVITIQGDRALYDFYHLYALFPAKLTHGEAYYTLITSTFLHAGFMHLAGNMLFLWIFGDNLEDELGHFGFLLFYLACGALAGAAQWAAEPWSPIPTVGASGAIAGVMGAYLLFFPKAKVDVLLWIVVFVRVFPIPAWIMLGVWFALQLVNGIGSEADQGGVAYWAHAGGFVAGFLLALPFWLREGGMAFWERTHGEPPHPEAVYELSKSSIPSVRRRR